jgi:hypothetical protein
LQPQPDILGAMKKLCILAIGLLLAGAGAALLAAPAPWFKWRSKVDGKLVCTQTPLGPGWEKATGPYQDSHCEKRHTVK